MKRKRAYYVRRPDGILICENGCAVPFPTLRKARFMAKAVGGTVGGWNWTAGRFSPLP